MKTFIPTFLYISNANIHDVNILDQIPYKAGSFFVVDKAYIDYRRLYRMHTQEAFFVTRAKDNMRFNRMYSKAVDKELGIRYNQIGKLETYYPKKEYPDKLRRIKYYDKDTDKEFVFLTNNSSLTAIEVAMLYKKRWEVELFLVDETAPEDKILLGNCLKCCEDPDVLRDHCLLFGSHRR